MKKSSRIAKAVAFKSWSQLPAMPLEDGEFSQVDGKKGSDSEYTGFKSKFNPF